MGAEQNTTRIRSVTRLHGGISSVVHRVQLQPVLGATQRGTRPAPESTDVVVKRPYVEHGLADSMYAVTHEAKMLDALASYNLVPRFVAVDPTGEYAGSPTIVQAMLPGRSYLSAGPGTMPSSKLLLGDWVHGLAEATQAVSQMTPTFGPPIKTQPPNSLLPRFVPWFSFDKPAPSWSSSPETWFPLMKDLLFSPPDSAAGNRFIHRDLHPGNVLFCASNPHEPISDPTDAHETHNGWYMAGMSIGPTPHGAHSKLTFLAAE